MKRLLLLFSLIAVLAIPAVMAQNQCPPPGAPKDPAKREQWFKEMRRNKHDFLVRELDLAPSQQEEFFKAYDAMEDELARLGEKTRKTEMAIVHSGDKPSDADYDRAIDELFEQKGREYKIELDAKEKFAKILTKRQLFRLKGAERKFFRSLMKHHRPAKDER